jgi:hypothetical protein
VSVLGKLWTSPNTLLGLAIGAIGLAMGARVQRGRNAIEFLDHPLIARVGRAAMVFGNTIHYAPGRRPHERVRRYDRAGSVVLGEHERAHYERWGPFFLVAYAICWLPFVPPRGNRFEHAADDAAERADPATD